MSFVIYKYYFIKNITQDGVIEECLLFLNRPMKKREKPNWFIIKVTYRIN